MITLKDLKILGFKDFKGIFNLADHLLNEKIYKYTSNILNKLRLGHTIKYDTKSFNTVTKNGSVLSIYLIIEDQGNSFLLTIKEVNGLSMNITEVIVNYDISFLSKNKKTVLSQLLKEVYVLILKVELNTRNILTIPLYMYTTLKSRFRYYNKIT